MVLPEFASDEDLLDRLTAQPDDLVYLVGSAVTAPPRAGAPGVPRIDGVVNLIREELRNSGTLRRFDAALASVVAPSSDLFVRYQAAFRFLIRARGQDSANAVIRRAVCQTRSPTTPVPSYPSTYDERTCRELEADLKGWLLPPATEALGRILAATPTTARPLVLTSNFDPLVAISIRRAGGHVYTTALHGDGGFTGIDGQGCLVVHFHGDWFRSDTLHLPTQIGQDRPKLAASLTQLLNARTLVVLGYGGHDDVFTRCLMAAIRGGLAPIKVAWAFHSSDESAIVHKSATLLRALQPGVEVGRVVLYKGIDVHSFLPRLAETLDPRLVKTPDPRPVETPESAPQRIRHTQLTPPARLRSELLNLRPKCAFPECNVTNPLDLASISSPQPGGPRYQPGQSAKQRAAISNFLLLCPNHHAIVDRDPSTYSVEWMRRTRAEWLGPSQALETDSRPSDALILTPSHATPKQRAREPKLAMDNGAFSQRLIDFEKTLSALMHHLNPDRAHEHAAVARRAPSGFLDDMHFEEPAVGSLLAYGGRGIRELTSMALDYGNNNTDSGIYIAGRTLAACALGCTEMALDQVWRAHRYPSLSPESFERLLAAVRTACETPATQKAARDGLVSAARPLRNNPIEYGEFLQSIQLFFKDGYPLLRTWIEDGLRDPGAADPPVHTRGTASTVQPIPSPSSTAEPTYEDEESRMLSLQLQKALSRKRSLTDVRADTSAVEREILDLKRRLREGGPLRAGDSLEDNRYLLLRQIGRGGFGTVWRAHDQEQNKEVAIKVLHPELARDPSRRERFLRGARVMAGFHHDAVVRVIKPHGIDGGYRYFVMELIEGEDLHRAVVGQRIPKEKVFTVVLQVADALAEAHAAGIVHRDIKPANILLDANNAPKLTDFDLVAADDTTGGTRTGAMGGLFYTAPEQLQNASEADARADVFGLGMTTIFCLHGGALPSTVIRRPEKVIEELSCFAGIRRVLTRSIELEPEHRYRDAREFREALQEAIESQATRQIAGNSPRRDLSIGMLPPELPLPQPTTPPGTTRNLLVASKPHEQNQGGSFYMLQSTFISYGGPDTDFAQKLNDALLKNGVTTFFFAKDAIPGQKLHRLMREGVNQHDRVILVCSKASLDRPGVLNEITETLQREARDGGKEYLIPITVDDYVFSGWRPADAGLAQAIRDRVVADFRQVDADVVKFNDAVLRLIKALKK